MTRRARLYEARVRARRSRAGLAGGDAADPREGDGGVAGVPRPDHVEQSSVRPTGASLLSPGPVQPVDGESLTVRPVTGAAASKTYVCPRCLQTIPPGVPHLVVWPVQTRLDGAEGLSVRRHWHRHCWTSHVRTAASGPAR